MIRDLAGLGRKKKLPFGGCYNKHIHVTLPRVEGKMLQHPLLDHQASIFLKHILQVCTPMHAHIWLLSLGVDLFWFSPCLRVASAPKEAST